MTDKTEDKFQRVQETLDRHKDSIMRLVHVVGVGVGEKYVGGRNTHEACITAFVERKVRLPDLKPEEVIPADIEGCPVDVVETGRFRLL